MSYRWVLPAAMIALLASGAHAQKFDDFGKGRAREALHNIAEDVKKGYYDPTFHGLDFDARVREADEKLEQVTSVGEVYRTFAWVLGGLNDSATFFVPARRNIADYGWEMRMVGDHCYVTHVRPKSDAEARGLKAGDEIMSVNSTAVTRETFPTLDYLLKTLSPQPELQIQVRTPSGQQSALKIAAKVDRIQRGMSYAVQFSFDFKEQKKRDRPRCQTVGEDLEICKMPDLNIEDPPIDDVLNLARKRQNLILDLRGNRHGTLEALKRLVSGTFDHEVKIGDRAERAGTKPQNVGPRHDPFGGKMVVLVDSGSRSVAEIFARVVQIEKRGTVVGDRSAGAVREGKVYEHRFKSEPDATLASYLAIVTEADTVMADGQSLENKGVIPDETLLPSAAALASGQDPVLARAAELLGVKLTPDQAGKLLPYEWPKE